MASCGRLVIGFPVRRWPTGKEAGCQPAAGCHPALHEVGDSTFNARPGTSRFSVRTRAVSRTASTFTFIDLRRTPQYPWNRVFRIKFASLAAPDSLPGAAFILGGA